jgi:hypothetical protein
LFPIRQAPAFIIALLGHKKKAPRGAFFHLAVTTLQDVIFSSVGG